MPRFKYMAEQYKIGAKEAYPVYEYSRYGRYGRGHDYGQTVEEDIAQLRKGQEEMKSALGSVGTWVTLGLIVIGAGTALRFLFR